MPFVFVLLGALVGGMVGGIPAALVGAVVMPMLWLALRKQEKSEPAGDESSAAAKDAEPAVTGLAARVKVLEQDVVALRAQVDRLTQGIALPDSIEPALTTQSATAAAEWESPATASWVTAAPPPAEAEASAAPSHAEMLADASTSLPLDATPEARPEASTEWVDAPPPSESTTAWTAPSPRAPAAPPIPLRDRLPSFLSRWIFGGNTIVKVGVLILFLGLAFLLRYAADRVTVPVEWRYVSLGLVGVFLLGLGWRLRSRTDAAGGEGYGLILQGAGVGVFYLTALAAIRLHPLLPPTVGFAFMAIVSVLGAVLAVSQNAPWLALVSVAEGFAAPVLVSTGGGNHVALFTYLAILDVGIFVMAWSRAWRPLNLVGAVSTFALATAWAHRHYDDSLYASVQFFLLLFFGLFTFIGVLFARRALAQGAEPDASQPLSVRVAQTLNLVGRVDSTLTFGVPLAAYGLQYLLVRDSEWGPAWSAFGFALFYLLLGGALLRGGHRRYALLGETFVIVSVIFGTLTIPLALEGTWTGATWAVEAAGMYWLGARQKRVYARVFALAVLAAAVARLVSGMTLDLQHGTPLLVGSALGMAMLGASAFAMDRVHRRIALDERNRLEAANDWVLPSLGVATLAAIAWLLLVPTWAGVVTAWLGFACVAVHTRFGGPALPWCSAALHAVALASLGLTLHTVEGRAMLASGWQGLAAASLIGMSLLMTVGLPLRRHLRAAEAKGMAPQWSMASSAGLLAGIGVLGMSLLFVMPADQAAWVWPWMGCGALWLGLRLAHPALGMSWFLLQLAAGIATIGYGPALWSSAAATSLWGPLVLTMAGFLSGDMLQRAAKTTQRPSLWTQKAPVQWGVVVWALGWWSQLLPPELHRQLRWHGAVELWPSVVVVWVLFSSMLMAAAATWRQWRVLGQATVAALPVWVLAAAIGPAGRGLRPSADMGWLAWPLALAWHLALLRLQQAWWWCEQQLKPVHVAGFWFFLLLAAREGQLFLQGLGAPGSAWSTLGFMLVPAIVLSLISRPGMLRRWPLSEHSETYLVPACGPVALYLLLWLWAGNTQSGAASPLPYVPLLNPLELGQGLVLLALVLWFTALPVPLREGIPRPARWGVLGATGFALYTGMVLRACHHVAGVPWRASALFDSTLTQAALSVAWSVVGVGVMVVGRHRTHRVVWAIGAGLLGVVVAKLFFIELADRGGLYRIVSFIVVGVLLLVVGYFAPVPPKRAEASADAPTV